MLRSRRQRILPSLISERVVQMLGAAFYPPRFEDRPGVVDAPELCGDERKSLPPIATFGRIAGRIVLSDVGYFRLAQIVFGRRLLCYAPPDKSRLRVQLPATDMRLLSYP